MFLLVEKGSTAELAGRQVTHQTTTYRVRSVPNTNPFASRTTSAQSLMTSDWQSNQYLFR
jgi:hypothetical protein